MKIKIGDGVPFVPAMETRELVEIEKSMALFVRFEKAIEAKENNEIMDSFIALSEMRIKLITSTIGLKHHWHRTQARANKCAELYNMHLESMLKKY